MRGKRNPFVAGEGILLLFLAAAIFAVAVRNLDVFLGAAAGFLFLVLYLLFRDPLRQIPAAPLGVVSPVDGQVIMVDTVDEGVLRGAAHRIQIQIDGLGTYTARAPVEGRIMDLRSDSADTLPNGEANALWLQTDEGDNVVLRFLGYRFGLAPRSLVQFGERVGQGGRCAYLRLTRCAEVQLPIASTLLVEPGQIVVAGADLIARVPHP